MSNVLNADHTINIKPSIFIGGFFVAQPLQVIYPGFQLSFIQI